MSDQSDQSVAISQPNQTQKDPKFTPKLNAALAKAQGEFIQPDKNKTVEVKKEGRILYTTTYADLKNVVEAFRPSLSKHGLSFTQKTVPNSKGWFLVLTLRHESGEYDETAMPINLDQAPQQVGSQLTYLKRYQAAAYFGIAADDDDDGNGAHGNEATFGNKGNGNKAQNQGKQQAPTAQAKKPPQQQKPPESQAPPKAAEDIPQEFPPDDVSPKESEKSDDPGDYVMLMGSPDVVGKKIKQLNEATLKKIKLWADDELKKTPPVKNMAQIFDIRLKVNAFLKSVGVE